MCSSASGSVVLSFGLLHATNIAIDYRFSSCKGQWRHLQKGFLRLPCAVSPEGSQLVGNDMRTIIDSAVVGDAWSLSSLMSGAQKMAFGTPGSSRSTDDLTIFVSRTDMGNFAQ